MIRSKDNRIGIGNVNNNIIKINFTLIFLSFLTIEYKIFVNKSIALFDVVFIILSISIFYFIKKKFNNLFFFSTIIIAISLINTFLIFYIHNNWNSLLGAIIILYLCSILYIYGQIFEFIKIEKIFKIFIYAVIVNCLISIAGIILYFTDTDTFLICTNCTSSNLLNNFPRFKNFAYSPNSYAFYNFIGIFLLSILNSQFNKKSYLFFILLLFISLVTLMTLSKTNLLIISFIIVFLFINRINYISLFLIFIFIFIINFIFTNILAETSCIYINEHIVQRCNLFLDTKKVYFENFIYNLNIYGNGFNNYINNIYPHNTLFDLYYTYGFFGILILFSISIFIIKNISKIENIHTKKTIIFFWLLIIIITINEDIFRYRELWISIAITYGLSKSKI
tara:strand:+ start:539 stop:1720 length:1182 start_codon:yes stop_codon:yes gene_type:complete